MSSETVFQHRWSRGVALALAATAIVWAGSCDDGSQSTTSRPKKLIERPNIVLVTIDTLRADHLGCYGYFRNTSPNIDALSKQSVLFEQAYAAMATTLPSHASMLTGRYPIEHGIESNVQFGGNMFGWKAGMLSFADVAKDAGYATAGFVSAAALKKGTGINQGFDTWDEPDARSSQRSAGETLAHVLPWLDQNAKEPFFLWVHFYDPHHPHRAPPPFDKQFDSDELDPKLEAWVNEREFSETSVRSNGKKVTETIKALNDYCAEIAYTDSQFGILIQELEKRSLLDKSILVVCADHGEGMNQHDWPAHGLVWDEQLRVPLLMRFPSSLGIQPQHMKRLVCLIDLFPTVLARMKPLATPKQKEFLALATGTDMLAPDYRELPVYSQRTGREVAEEVDPGEMYGVTTPDWKFIHEPTKGDKLFNRRTDPFELDNVYLHETTTAQRMSKLTELMRAQQKMRGEALGPTPMGAANDEMLRQLKELGYADGGGGGGATPEDSQKPLDTAAPKDDAKPDDTLPPKNGKKPGGAKQ